jgi:hypothetical protein
MVKSEAVTVHTDWGNFEVDPKFLGNNLRTMRDLASRAGVRPGQPTLLASVAAELRYKELVKAGRG